MALAILVAIRSRGAVHSTNVEGKGSSGNSCFCVCGVVLFHFCFASFYDVVSIYAFTYRSEEV